jgi:hypothetical protein
MNIIFILALSVAFAAIIDAIRRYRKTPGNEWLTAFYNSATVALSRIVQIISGIVLTILQFASSIASLITDPSTSDAIKGVVAQYKPEMTAIVVLVMALAGAFEATRRRSLGKDEQS